MANSSQTEKLTVEGLRDQVDIFLDQWGVPHIYAQNTPDLFFAQGYQAARMRLWQMDTWRRRGLGLVSEVMGERYVAQDRMARLLLYRGDLTDEAKQYGPQAGVIIDGFVAGVNAYVAAVRAGEAELPVEFSALGYQPDFWAVEDIHRIRAGGRHDNAREEVLRSVMIREFGAEAERLRKPLSNDWTPTIPDGLDLDDIDAGLLEDFNQFMVFMSAADQNLIDGSNHWAVAGAKTRSGRPLLASDPHRDMSLPPLRYVCHLSAPGIDVIGAAEPYRPGVTMGHNRDVAYALTIFPCDQEDIYVYETNEDGTQYRYNGEWVDFEFVDEEISARGGAATTHRLQFSRHGPIVAVRPERRRAYGLRAVWLEPGAVPYFKAGLGCIFAKCADDVRRIAAVSVTPGTNFVFADTNGDIGLRPGGMLPKRPNWDGLMPVPGDGRYEWDGLLSVSTLLDVVNPDEGWAGNANQYNIPPTFADLAVCLEAEPDHRYKRIEQVLRDVSAHDVEEAQALQMDVVSLPAQRLCRLLANLTFADSDTDAARSTLVDWDGTLSKDSYAAALFQVWWRVHLLPAAMRHHLARHGAERRDEAVAHILKSTDMSKTPDLWLRLVEDEAQSEPMIALLGQTLAAAARQLAQANLRNWGDLHKLALHHPLAERLARATSKPVADFSAGAPAPVDGDGDTVNNTGFRPDWIQKLGASVRFVFDVGDWDSSQAMVVPGQTGKPEDPHFRDQYQPWLAGQAFPLLYSRTAVEEKAVLHSVLATTTQQA